MPPNRRCTLQSGKTDTMVWTTSREGKSQMFALLVQCRIPRECRLAIQPRLEYAVPILAKATRELPHSTLSLFMLNMSLKVCWSVYSPQLVSGGSHCAAKGRSLSNSQTGQHRTRSPLGNSHLNQPNGSSSRANQTNGSRPGSGSRNAGGKSSSKLSGHAFGDFRLSSAAKTGRQVGGQSYWSNPNLGV